MRIFGLVNERWPSHCHWSTLLFSQCISPLMSSLQLNFFSICENCNDIYIKFFRWSSTTRKPEAYGSMKRNTNFKIDLNLISKCHETRKVALLNQKQTPYRQDRTILEYSLSLSSSSFWSDYPCSEDPKM